MKKYLIAGGAGFIGSHLAERLVLEGNEVTIVDNLCTGSLDNLSDIYDKISFVHSDVCCFETAEEYDVIFHLACIANPRDYVESSLSLLSSASFGTQKLLEIADKSKARFYYFSSSEVYGHHMKSSEFALSEDSYSSIGLLHERSPYYVSKMFGEEYVKAYSVKHGFDYVIIRPFNVYGTRMDIKSPYGRVISNFIRWSVIDKPLQINGDGKQTRSFCHINDFLDAVFLLENHSIFKHSVINIGNPVSVSIFDLATIIQSVSQKELPIIYEKKIEHEPLWRKPDITRINQLTGWSPKVKLEDGLREVYEWTLERM